MIRVGRCVYDRKGKRTDPSYDGFSPIVVLTRSLSKWGVLGPYELRDNKGRIMENIYQTKCYEKVPKSVQRYSRYDSTVIWDHPAEIHAVKDENGDWDPTDKYWEWRKKLAENEYAVRYPVGFHYRHNCLFAIGEKEDENGKVTYFGPL